jgi:hypothetical protein
VTKRPFKPTDPSFKLPAPRYTATQRHRIPEKRRECDFFLNLMDRAVKDGRAIEEFLFFLSAFLSAFRSLEYRATGAVEHEGTSQPGSFWSMLQADRDMKFVKGISDFEVHGDGIRLYENVPGGPDVTSLVYYPPNLVLRCGAALNKLKNAIDGALHLNQTL